MRGFISMLAALLLSSSTLASTPAFMQLEDMGIEHPVARESLEAGELSATPGEADERDSSVSILPVGGSSSNITITGHVFYEDHRQSGQFERRSDLNGDAGVPPGDRTRNAQWLLGAYHMMVDVYERDSKWLGSSCRTEEKVGSAMVREDGSFSLSFSHNDPCSRDDWSTPRFSLKVRARFCNSDGVCFQVGPGRNDYYALSWHHDRPFAVSTGSTHDVGNLLFSPAGQPAMNDHARAANQFASLAETIATLHHENGIPFRMSAYGGLQARYPSPDATGRATDYDLIDLNNSGWPEGGKAMHEYGHIVHRRAWGGDYAGHHNPIQSWNSSDPEEPFIAMKEGWANFVQRYVDGTCFQSDYDTTYNFDSGSGNTGNQFPNNHHRLFCDWVDGANDLRPGMNGVGDAFQASLYSLWHNLDRTDETISIYDGHNPVDPGLGICDLVGYYLEVRKSPTEVGEAVHEEYLWRISSLLEQHDMSCRDVPDPDTLRVYDFASSIRLIAVDDGAVDATGNGIRIATLEVEASNEHEYISTGLGRLKVDSQVVGDASQRVLNRFLALDPGEASTYTVDIEVPMVDGNPKAVLVTANVTDIEGYEVERSNNAASLLLSERSMRPNLTIFVPSRTEERPDSSRLGLTVEIHNTGVTTAHFGSVRTPARSGPALRIEDSAGHLYPVPRIFGQIAPGDFRTFDLELDVPESVWITFNAYVRISVDPTDSIEEISEGDNSATLRLTDPPLIELPEWLTYASFTPELVETSMWVAELQHEMLRDFATHPLPWWSFESAVDQSFARQLAESRLTLFESHGQLQPVVPTTIGIDPLLTPSASSVEAQRAAQRWRYMP